MRCCILDPSSNSWALPYLRLPSLCLFLLHIGSSAYLCIYSHVPFSSRKPLPCGFFCIEKLSFQPWLSAAPLCPWCDTCQTVLTCWTESVHPGKTEAALLPLYLSQHVVSQEASQVTLSLQGWCFLILIRREYAFLMSYDLTSPGIIRWDGKWWWTVIEKFTYKEKRAEQLTFIRNIGCWEYLYSYIWDWEAGNQVLQDTYLQNFKSQIAERLGKQKIKVIVI